MADGFCICICIPLKQTAPEQSIQYKYHAGAVKLIGDD